MRQIKFRAKIKGHIGNLFGVPCNVYRDKDYNDKWFDSMQYWEDGEFLSEYIEENTLSQCSPFKDKNGKEIYEGDIIGDWTEVDGKMEQSKMQVYFDEMLGQWMLDCSLKQDKSMSYSLFNELEDFEYEVIGNIFESQQLVSEAV